MNLIDKYNIFQKNFIIIIENIDRLFGLIENNCIFSDQHQWIFLLSMSSLMRDVAIDKINRDVLKCIRQFPCNVHRWFATHILIVLTLNIEDRTSEIKVISL